MTICWLNLYIFLILWVSKNLQGDAYSLNVNCFGSSVYGSWICIRFLKSNKKFNLFNIFFKSHDEVIWFQPNHVYSIQIRQFRIVSLSKNRVRRRTSTRSKNLLQLFVIVNMSIVLLQSQVVLWHKKTRNPISQHVDRQNGIFCNFFSFGSFHSYFWLKPISCWLCCVYEFECLCVHMRAPKIHGHSYGERRKRPAALIISELPKNVLQYLPPSESGKLHGNQSFWSG